MIPYPLNGDIRSSADLTSLYRQYLRVLNNRTFDLLSRFVARRCMHNGHRMSSHEYSQLIKSGATFCADEIVADVSQRTIAARLHIEFLSSCTKAGSSKTSPINSHAHSPTRTCTTGPRHVTRLNEHVFYHFDENWRIDRVWSMLEDVSDHVNQLNSVSSGRDA